MLPQPLDVIDEVPGGVVDETGVGTALAAAALIEQHDPVAGRIEEAAHLGVEPSARPPVQKHRRLAVRIAAFLEVKLVDVRDAQKTRAVRFDRWIEAPARACSRWCCHARQSYLQSPVTSIPSPPRAPRRNEPPTVEWRVAPVLAALAAAATAAAHAAGPPPSCGGPAAFLAVIGRPTVEDSGCVVPQGMSDLEAGATAGNLYPAPGGRFYTMPNLTLRWGLPDDSEFVWLPPGF